MSVCTDTKHHMGKEWRIVKEIFKRVLLEIKSMMTPTEPNDKQTNAIKQYQYIPFNIYSGY